jgi:hypothetical protein
MSPTSRSELEKHYYTWRDLRISHTIQVYGRSMLIFDCDKFTRSWYKDKMQLTDEQLTPLKVTMQYPNCMLCHVHQHQDYVRFFIILLACCLALVIHLVRMYHDQHLVQTAGYWFIDMVEHIVDGCHSVQRHSKLEHHPVQQTVAMKESFEKPSRHHIAISNGCLNR